MSGLRLRAAPIDAVDEVTLTSGTDVTATKTIHAGDPYLEGHYPDFTIYPGVFIMESVGQTVDHYVALTFGADRMAELTTVTSVRFTAPLLPGDTLRVFCAIAVDGDVLRVKASCKNAADISAATMKLEYNVMDRVAE
ncbi:hypothetical protein ABVG11_20060 [Streptomyces sp. HD1123-B1]|uniref:3-hydroxyacyl-ACP dehydratase FabZ family protein n=1 Tax=Streptomyces TaxID=1883 RepID=UPI003D724654